MKRLFAVVLMLSLLLVGCQVEKNTDVFDTYPPEETAAYTVGEFGRFVYKLYKEADNYGFTLGWISGKYERGEELSIQIDVKSLMNKEHTVHGYEVDLKLNCQEKEYVIRQDPNRSVPDVYAVVLSPYTEFQTGDYLTIPINAVAGTYDLECTFDGETVIFENLFTLS